MKHTLSIATAGLLLTSAAAMAQPATHSPAGPNTTRSQQMAAATTNPGNLRQQMKSDLEKAGFADVTVVPDSFLVQAKDKSGNPVTMMINPNSMTEVVGTADSSSKTGASNTYAGAGTSSNTSGAIMPSGNAGSDAVFSQIPPSDKLSSQIVGLDVYNKSNQDIGKIKDIAYSGSGTMAYIVGVGGFLGMGDHYVAVNPSDISLSYDNNAKKWHASMDTTADKLKAAPEFKYPSAT